MDNRTPFDLNEAIRRWQESLGASPALSADNQGELAAHLRASVQKLQVDGLSEEEAFLAATRRLGERGALEREPQQDYGGSEGEEMKYSVLIVAGGVLGGIATLIYAFQFDHVPTTNNGVNGVLAGPMPVGVVCGGMAGALIAHRWCKRTHH
jgi:cytochrome c-type biogenesis protein CcmH/NrfG